MKWPIIVASLFFVSCNAGNSSNTAGTDTTGSSQQVIVNSGSSSSSGEMVNVTPFEMKDDSVFIDGTKPSSWADAGFADEKGFKLFLKQAQIWIMDNDKEKLASIIKYPLKNIKTPGELVEKYDAVFTKDVKLSFATINFNQIFRNQQGAMTEGGKVWFAQDGKDFKIIAVNY